MYLFCLLWSIIVHSTINHSFDRGAGIVVEKGALIAGICKLWVKEGE